MERDVVRVFHGMTSRGKSRVKKTFLILSSLTLLLLLGSGVFAFFLHQASKELPPVQALREYKPSQVTRIYANDGRIIGEFYIEKRVLVPFKNIPLHLRQAVVSVEDDSFYTHRGIDYPGVVRAFVV
ncbi:MAG: transglycosylase domain-containing protein, partial [Nitrospirae bacterium]|nr:transglycosylase domain-containing protein [Nitrospirota bacterium]